MSIISEAEGCPDKDKWDEFIKQLIQGSLQELASYLPVTDNIITPEGKAPITKVGSLKVVNLEGGVEGVMLSDWGFDFSSGVKMTDSKEVGGVHTAYIGGYTMQELKEIYARRAEWGVL